MGTTSRASGMATRSCLQGRAAKIAYNFALLKHSKTWRTSSWDRCHASMPPKAVIAPVPLQRFSLVVINYTFFIVVATINRCISLSAANRYNCTYVYRRFQEGDVCTMGM